MVALFKSIFNSIVMFFKNTINIRVENNQKYNVKKNKNCNIAINEYGENNDKR